MREQVEQARIGAVARAPALTMVMVKTRKTKTSRWSSETQMSYST